MMIQCNLQPHPKDGSRLIWKLYNGSFESIFAKEKYFCQAKYNFGFSGHSDRRSVQPRRYLLSQWRLRAMLKVAFSFKEGRNRPRNCWWALELPRFCRILATVAINPMHMCNMQKRSLHRRQLCGVWASWSSTEADESTWRGWGMPMLEPND